MPSTRLKAETYKRLNELAGMLQVELKKPISMDDVLNYLLRVRKMRPSDYAGAWTMSDEEEESILRSLSERWSVWKFPRE